ncbi:MAG: hypothetical protein WBP65_17845, partial [Candidatus Sulfotelmatobacter sp.]
EEWYESLSPLRVREYRTLDVQSLLESWTRSEPHRDRTTDSIASASDSAEFNPTGRKPDGRLGRKIRGASDRDLLA